MAENKAKKRWWNWQNWPSYQKRRGFTYASDCHIPRHQGPPVKIKLRLKRYPSFAVQELKNGIWYEVGRYWTEDEACAVFEELLEVDKKLFALAELGNLAPA